MSMQTSAGDSMNADEKNAPALPGALVSLAFPFYADRWPGTIDNEFAYCLVAGALWPLVVIEVARWRQVRLRVKSLSGAGA